MRKNPKSIHITVLGYGLYDTPEVRALQERGHEVDYTDQPEGDVVIGSHAWRIDPALGHLDKQLQMMVEGVRNIKYPKKKEEQ